MEKEDTLYLQVAESMRDTAKSMLTHVSGLDLGNVIYRAAHTVAMNTAVIMADAVGFDDEKLIQTLYKDVESSIRTIRESTSGREE